MEQRFGRNPTMDGSQSDPQVGWNFPVPETGLEVSMWQLGLGGRNSYPERQGEPNCVYYMRTGSCGYGDRCRYNHPRDRTTATSAVRQGGGEYPEREGQPVCQFFLKTGTCKFGAYCKFHHPKYGGQSMTTLRALNYYGYPLRPGEKECSYYVQTGQCKFGLTCKFDHPQPASVSMPAPTPAHAQTPAPAFYPTVQSPSLPSQPYGGVTASWQVPSPALLPGSYVQGAFGPVLLPPGMVPISGWSPYPAPLSPVDSPGTQPTLRPRPLYGVTQLSPSATEFVGPYRPLAAPAPLSSSSVKEHMFPERPGQPECQYYMRTGDCKFGTTCRYHHPPEWITPKTNCALSAMGLPLRPGALPCTFYMQHGICKFGPTCKFDHPMVALSYSPSASSLADMPVAPYPVGSSLATLAPSSSSSDFRPEYITGSNNSFSTRMSSSSGLVGSMFSKNYILHSGVQLSGQSPAPSRGSSSVGHGGEVCSST